MARTSKVSPFAALAAAVVIALPAAAVAQGYPNRPITLIIPFAAGGPSDTLGRLTADHLGRTLGQQLVIENVGGAGGTVGTERAAKAAPDGYTLFQHHTALPAAAALYANLALRHRHGLRAARSDQYRPDGAGKPQDAGRKGRQGADRLAQGAWRQGNRRSCRRRFELASVRAFADANARYQAIFGSLSRNRPGDDRSRGRTDRRALRSGDDGNAAGDRLAPSRAMPSRRASDCPH